MMEVAELERKYKTSSRLCNGTNTGYKGSDLNTECASIKYIIKKKSKNQIACRTIGNWKTGKSNATNNQRKLVTQDITNSNHTVLLDQIVQY